MSTRTPRGTFAKGISGNPGGRPKAVAEVHDVLRAASPKAAARLVALVESKDDRVALKAAEAILARTVAPLPEAPDTDVDDAVAVVERRLLSMALAGDRAAALAYLAARAPERYGADVDVDGSEPDADPPVTASPMFRVMTADEVAAIRARVAKAEAEKDLSGLA